MLKITKEQRGAVLFVEMSGVVDESSGFDQIGPVQVSEMTVRCADINRINSAGVRLWIKYFQDLKNKNVRVTLVDAASVLVEQMNMIVNFASGMAVNSIMMPYACAKCGECSQFAGKVADLKAGNFEVPNQKCPSCGGEAAFDDLPEEYFHFLTR